MQPNPLVTDNGENIFRSKSNSQRIPKPLAKENINRLDHTRNILNEVSISEIDESTSFMILMTFNALDLTTKGRLDWTLSIPI